MGYAFAEKALARAGRVWIALFAGQIIDARPDVALSHDNTAAIAKLFRSLGYGRVLRPERLAIFLDHAVPAPNAEHALNHKEIREFVAEQGIEHFYERGPRHLPSGGERGGAGGAGQLLLGADSHTPHIGWFGAFGAGIGRSEMAAYLGHRSASGCACRRRSGSISKGNCRRASRPRTWGCGC